MFLSTPDRMSSPFSVRNSSLILGSVLMIMTAAALFSARTVPVGLAAVVISIATLAVARERLMEGWPQWDWAKLAIAGYILWAAVSAFWSLEPLMTLEKSALAALTAIGSFAAAKWCLSEQRRDILRLAEGLWIGFIVGLVYFLIEILSEQSLKIWAYNLVGIGPDQVKAAWFTFENGRITAINFVDLTRNATPITLLFWPCLMAIIGAADSRWHRPVIALMCVLTVLVVLLSPHETSKLALIGSTACFALSFVSRRWVWRLLALAWCISCLLIVPLVHTAYRHDLHNAGWLQNSARHRIIIWNYTAEEIMRSPWIGAGAVSTYVLGQYVKPEVAEAEGEEFDRTLSQHAHNVFLQTWYELGAMGALLLLGVGLAVIRRLSRLPFNVQPYAAATFSAAAVVAATSYGIWQAWFMATFGFAAVAFAVCVRAYMTIPVAQPASTAPSPATA